MPAFFEAGIFQTSLFFADCFFELLLWFWFSLVRGICPFAFSLRAFLLSVWLSFDILKSSSIFHPLSHSTVYWCFVFAPKDTFFVLLPLFWFSSITELTAPLCFSGVCSFRFC